jgi:hypothetical protein
MKNNALYDNSVELLIERYESLVKHTEKVVFSPLNLKFAEWPDLENRPRWQTILLNIVFPYSPLNDDLNPKGKVFQYLILLVWFFYVQMWLNAARSILAPTPAEPAAATTFWLFPILIILIIPVFLLIPVPYIQLGWFLFSNKNSLMTRLLGVVGMIVFVVLTFWYAQNYDQESLIMISLTDGQAVSVLFGLIIPAYIFLFWIVTFAFFIALNFILNSLTAILRSAQPIALKGIRKIALEPVSANGNSWSLKDLTLLEINALRLWSEQNSDANEKKTVPNLVVMALLALLIGAPLVQDILNQIIESATQLMMKVVLPQTNTTTTEYLGGYILIMIVLMFATSQVENFRNFSTQAVIRQACVVAEYAKQLEISQTSLEQAKPSPLFTFLDRLFSLLDRILKDKK